MEFKCNECNTLCSSYANLRVHVREKHTFANTRLQNCTMCLKQFHSVDFNKGRTYDKCEDCRNLLKKFKNRSSLINGSIFYDNSKNLRYQIIEGTLLPLCKFFYCQNEITCEKHNQNQFKVCQSQKCNNCYEINISSPYCQYCQEKDHRSKDKRRQAIHDFKIELGGKCVECGFDEPFFLEFDHIDSSKKIKQITRSVPSHWRTEKANLQLLCGRCHRYKNYCEYSQLSKIDRYKKYKQSKKDLINKIKLNIGKCQICHWSSDNIYMLLCNLDFDHIKTNNKLGSVSELISANKSLYDIYLEILKTRLLCRHCHELYTCLQKGGRVLKLYYTQSEIYEWKNKLMNYDGQQEIKKYVPIPYIT